MSRFLPGYGGSRVLLDGALTRSFDKGRAYSFCSQRCKETFDKDPQKYAIASAKGGHGSH